LKAPDMEKALAAMGIEDALQGPADFGNFVQAEGRRFAAVLKPLAAQK
jgi:hypothetical protein